MNQSSRIILASRQTKANYEISSYKGWCSAEIPTARLPNKIHLRYVFGQFFLGRFRNNETLYILSWFLLERDLLKTESPGT